MDIESCTIQSAKREADKGSIGRQGGNAEGGTHSLSMSESVSNPPFNKA